MKQYLFKVVAVIFILFTNLNTSNGQIISTIAGVGGSCGFSGDGGFATSAQACAVQAVAIDALGNKYFTEFHGNRIRKVNSSGIISTFAGTGVAGFSGDGGPATLAQIDHPTGIVADASGNLYVAEYGSSKIRKIDPSGIITTFAGTGVAGFSGDGGPAISAQLNVPNNLATDASGNIYIADKANHRIRKINSNGIITTVVGNGTQGFSGDGGLATAAEINLPHDVEFDGLGNMFVLDTYNQRIRKVNSAGIIITIAGNGIVGFTGDGGSASLAQINHPSGLVIDPSNNIYFCDMLNHRLRKINSSGIITTFAGTGVAGFSGDGGLPTSAQIAAVDGDLAIDGSGNIYFPDGMNNRVRMICQSNCAVGINEESLVNIEDIIYPNPANNILNIDLKNEEVLFKFIILNDLGQILREEQLNNNTIDVNALPNGIYFLNFYSDKYGNVTKKFVIAR
ncbi:MAG: T9SS type A sorting domain-containing protein [Bacteroidota bacterium]|nr:T9SS type A sorting domain-containing protein [Bacteroidota bacterium]